MVNLAKSPDMKTNDLTGQWFTRPEDLVQYELLLVICWPPCMCQAGQKWMLPPLYLSVPPTEQDLTQGIFYIEDLGGGRAWAEIWALQVEVCM